MPHWSSYGCSNNTGKYSITALSLFLPFESTRELKQWSSGFAEIDRHRHNFSADATRPGWIDLTTKATKGSMWLPCIKSSMQISFARCAHHRVCVCVCVCVCLCAHTRVLLCVRALHLVQTHFHTHIHHCLYVGTHRAE